MAKANDPAKSVESVEATAAEGPSKELLSGIRKSDRAQTILFVHGIGNKPEQGVLKCQWDQALFNIDLGDRSRLAYWVNRAYYPDPVSATCASKDDVHIDDEGVSPQSLKALAETSETELIEAEIELLARENGDEEVLRALAARALASPFASTPSMADAPGRLGISAVEAKVLFFLPPFVRRHITRKITRAFLRDVNDFLFREERREVMRRSVLERLEVGGGPFVVIGHSQGSIVAYDVLRTLSEADVEVPLFVTIGSPLGLQEVQDVLKEWTGKERLEVPSCVGAWLNVADRLDPVAFDSDLRNDFKPKARIQNVRGLGLNPDSPRHPHSGTGYLKLAVVRQAVRAAVGSRFPQEVADFVIARDLVRQIENAAAEERHHVLIQLQTTDERDRPMAIDEAREKVLGALQELPVLEGTAPGEAELEARMIDPLRRYVSADLTRSEIERLRARHKELALEIVWKNADKRALVHTSINTIQCAPAIRSYGAEGQGVRWAVLDTGINSDHPHFADGVVIEQWDCTRPGDPAPVGPEADGHGHGTHVGAIIAGGMRVQDRDGKEVEMKGMAPKARLVGYKVLDDSGRGRDSFIIKALDHIASANEGVGEPFIHGVNLSLGGSFDPSVFGCGHTPLCRELRRLWGQGLVVVLAAGNEGWARLQGQTGWVEANLDLSIGDPANLEEAIAVGSVHRSKPHTYGVSFFSSRGPTADGRLKPDLVAPGEKIVSACHEFANPNGSLDELYVTMSGTSMAAPHVSGLIAAFLSLRREFVGFPNRMKEILLESCTDLGRDRYIQGHGMPNLVKMLALR